MNRLTDTSPEAERVLIEVYRRMPFARRWGTLGGMFGMGRVLHAAGMRLRSPAVTAAEIRADWIAQTLRLSPANLPPGLAFNLPADELGALRRVMRACTQLGIPHALAGGLASSIHGYPRFNRDADLAVAPFAGRERQLLSALGPDYCVDLPALQEAVRCRSRFHLIHVTGFKVDVFVCPDEPFEQSALRRRIEVELPDTPGELIAVQAPEDVILFKLRWHHVGAESPEEQWQDVLGVLKVQGGALDAGYLEQWARYLGVDDLLSRARQESQV